MHANKEQSKLSLQCEIEKVATECVQQEKIRNKAYIYWNDNITDEREEHTMRKQLLTLTLATTLLTSSLVANPVAPVQGATTTPITGKEYVKMLEKAIGKEIDTVGVALSGNITLSDACVLANRADILKNGEKESDSVLTKKDNIIKYNRISNLKQIPKVKQGEVISCFAKGIFTGKSDGWYTQSDTISTKAYLNKSLAQTIRNRIINKKVRKKITEDGQVIRTTKLPKNASKYPYIVESLPNSFYDGYYFNFEGTTKLLANHDKIRYPKDVDKNDYWYLWDQKIPAKKIIDRHRLAWADKVKKNLKIRLNFDYRTVTNRWNNDLQQTYFIYNDDYDHVFQKYISSYVRKAKRNHVIIKCDDVVVEPSSLYYSPATIGYTFRCYAKFTIQADSYTKELQKNNGLIFSNETSYIWEDETMGKNGTYAFAFDISIGTSAFNDDGSTYAVSWNGDAIDYNKK